MLLEDFIIYLKNSFKQDAVKKAVVDEKWYLLNKETGQDSLGFCYASSELIFRLYGGEQKWNVMRIGQEDWSFGSHYYLEDKFTKEILDVTSDQYTGRGIDIPYALGKRHSFGKLSVKAENLAKAIGIDLPEF